MAFLDPAGLNFDLTEIQSRQRCSRSRSGPPDLCHPQTRALVSGAELLLICSSWETLVMHESPFPLATVFVLLCSLARVCPAVGFSPAFFTGDWPDGAPVLVLLGSSDSGDQM